MASSIDGPRNLTLKFGQNRASNSLDIADMDKCPQDKFCLDKCCGDSCNLLYMFPGPFIQSLIKIEPVTASKPSHNVCRMRQMGNKDYRLQITIHAFDSFYSSAMLPRLLMSPGLVLRTKA